MAIQGDITYSAKNPKNSDELTMHLLFDIDDCLQFHTTKMYSNS